MKSGPLWEKKGKNCDPQVPEDSQKGDQWDHTSLDVESRLVVSLVIGKRDRDTLKEVVEDFAERTGNIPPLLTTTDDCSTYADVLLEQYGQTVVPPKTGKPGRPRKPYKEWPEGATYATVNKTYREGRVVAVTRTLVHGSEEELALALKASPASSKINTAFVERQNGTDRTYNARKARKTYEFSKELIVHIAVSWWVMLCYNFHHLHRGLLLRLADETYLPRTPAMAKGLAERPLTTENLFMTQVIGFTPPITPSLADFRRRRASGPAP